ncbi:nucleoside/nucleotide kinase family protein [Gordonia sp. SL306]|uniref:nucleoside/nucleotide kinase family protein n=1 Tax=Gordonia sp. SL306 TaxID=2995145 RepID=UPI00227225CD|nr:nucleoside/nucleotide kinase family protein [Gordonia sp. SL306]WAC54814.1 nucleoside/nucleotide kinase family protein [Gordonia sp. SL306]
MSVLTDLDDALAAHTGERIVVGVTGPPGSGKTTLARTLTEHYRRLRGDSFVGYLPMDGFHLANTVLAQLNRSDRKGAPDTFDVDGYVALLGRAIGADRDVYAPDFDHTAGEPIAAALVLPATSALIITEGNYLALDDGSWSPVAGMLTRLYYVDAPADLRRDRLLPRHVAAGKSPQAARAWVENVDEPNAALVAGTRDRADLVIDGTVTFA